MSVAKGRIGAFTVWWVFIAALLALAAGCSGGGQSPGVPADDTATGTPEVNSGSGGAVPADEWNPDDFEHVYDVGPGRAYSDPAQVPWESLGPTSRIEPNGW